MIELKEDQRWKHIKSGKVYFVTALGKLKFNGEWYQSVSYCRADGSESEIYARTIEDFREKFEYVYG